ncbi:metal ABC transporter permease, partial [Streptococcus agalactiae]|nr:metal ABC transporter permease [Streptococcus agalactiae]
MLAGSAACFASAPVCLAAPVPGGRPSPGPPVAPFLVGSVPPRPPGVLLWALSPRAPRCPFRPCAAAGSPRPAGPPPWRFPAVCSCVSVPLSRLGRRLCSRAARFVCGVVGLLPLCSGSLPPLGPPSRRPCLPGRLPGAVASSPVPAAPPGSLRLVGPPSSRVPVSGRLPARAPPRAGPPVGLRAPVVPSGRALAPRLPAPLGLPGFSPPAFPSPGRFGPSLSARRLLGLSSVPRVGLFAPSRGPRAGFRPSCARSVPLRRGRRPFARLCSSSARPRVAFPLVSPLSCPRPRWVALSGRAPRCPPLRAPPPPAALSPAFLSVRALRAAPVARFGVSLWCPLSRPPPPRSRPSPPALLPPFRFLVRLSLFPFACLRLPRSVLLASALPLFSCRPRRSALARRPSLGVAPVRSGRRFALLRPRSVGRRACLFLLLSSVRVLLAASLPAPPFGSPFFLGLLLPSGRLPSSLSAFVLCSVLLWLFSLFFGRFSAPFCARSCPPSFRLRSSRPLCRWFSCLRSASGSSCSSCLRSPFCAPGLSCSRFCSSPLPFPPAPAVFPAAALLPLPGLPPGVPLRFAPSLPLCAGLGGGSPAAAAPLRALPRFWPLPLGLPPWLLLVFPLVVLFLLALVGAVRSSSVPVPLFPLPALAPLLARSGSAGFWSFPSLPFSRSCLSVSPPRCSCFLPVCSFCPPLLRSWSSLGPSLAALPFLPPVLRPSRPSVPSGAAVAFLPGRGPPVFFLCSPAPPLLVFFPRLPGFLPRRFSRSVVALPGFLFFPFSACFFSLFVLSFPGSPPRGLSAVLPPPSPLSCVPSCFRPPLPLPSCFGPCPRAVPCLLRPPPFCCFSPRAVAPFCFRSAVPSSSGRCPSAVPVSFSPALLPAPPASPAARLLLLRSLPCSPLAAAPPLLLPSVRGFRPLRPSFFPGRPGRFRPFSCSFLSRLRRVLLRSLPVRGLPFPSARAPVLAGVPSLSPVGRFVSLPRCPWGCSSPFLPAPFGLFPAPVGSRSSLSRPRRPPFRLASFPPPLARFPAGFPSSVFCLCALWPLPSPWLFFAPASPAAALFGFVSPLLVCGLLALPLGRFSGGPRRGLSLLGCLLLLPLFCLGCAPPGLAAGPPAPFSAFLPLPAPPPGPSVLLLPPAPAAVRGLLPALFLLFGPLFPWRCFPVPPPPWRLPPLLLALLSSAFLPRALFAVCGSSSFCSPFRPLPPFPSSAFAACSFAPRFLRRCCLRLFFGLSPPWSLFSLFLWRPLSSRLCVLSPPSLAFSPALLLSLGLALSFLVLRPAPPVGPVRLAPSFFGSLLPLGPAPVLALFVLAFSLFFSPPLSSPLSLFLFAAAPAFVAGLPVRPLSLLFPVVPGLALAFPLPAAGALLVSPLLVFPARLALRFGRPFPPVLFSWAVPWLCGPGRWSFPFFFLGAPCSCPLPLLFLGLFLFVRFVGLLRPVPSPSLFFSARFFLSLPVFFRLSFLRAPLRPSLAAVFLRFLASVARRGPVPLFFAFSAPPSSALLPAVLVLLVLPSCCALCVAFPLLVPSFARSSRSLPFFCFLPSPPSLPAPSLPRRRFSFWALLLCLCFRRLRVRLFFSLRCPFPRCFVFLRLALWLFPFFCCFSPLLCFASPFCPPFLRVAPSFLLSPLCRRLPPLVLCRRLFAFLAVFLVSPFPPPAVPLGSVLPSFLRLLASLCPPARPFSALPPLSPLFSSSPPLRLLFAPSCLSLFGPRPSVLRPLVPSCPLLPPRCPRSLRPVVFPLFRRPFVVCAPGWLLRPSFSFSLRLLCLLPCLCASVALSPFSPALPCFASSASPVRFFCRRPSLLCLPLGCRLLLFRLRFPFCCLCPPPSSARSSWACFVSLFRSFPSLPPSPCSLCRPFPRLLLLFLGPRLPPPSFLFFGASVLSSLVLPVPVLALLFFPPPFSLLCSFLRFFPGFFLSLLLLPRSVFSSSFLAFSPVPVRLPSLVFARRSLLFFCPLVGLRSVSFFRSLFPLWSPFSAVCLVFFLPPSGRPVSSSPFPVVSSGLLFLPPPCRPLPPLFLSCPLLPRVSLPLPVSFPFPPPSFFLSPPPACPFLFPLLLFCARLFSLLPPLSLPLPRSLGALFSRLPFSPCPLLPCLAGLCSCGSLPSARAPLVLPVPLFALFPRPSFSLARPSLFRALPGLLLRFFPLPRVPPSVLVFFVLRVGAVLPSPCLRSLLFFPASACPPLPAAPGLRLPPLRPPWSLSSGAVLSASRPPAFPSAFPPFFPVASVLPGPVLPCAPPFAFRLLRSVPPSCCPLGPPPPLPRALLVLLSFVPSSPLPPLLRPFRLGPPCFRSVFSPLLSSSSPCPSLFPPLSSALPAPPLAAPSSFFPPPALFSPVFPLAPSLLARGFSSPPLLPFSLFVPCAPPLSLRVPPPSRCASPPCLRLVPARCPRRAVSPRPSLSPLPAVRRRLVARLVRAPLLPRFCVPPLRPLSAPRVPVLCVPPPLPLFLLLLPLLCLPVPLSPLFRLCPFSSLCSPVGCGLLPVSRFRRCLVLPSVASPPCLWFSFFFRLVPLFSAFLSVLLSLFVLLGVGLAVGSLARPVASVSRPPSPRFVPPFLPFLGCLGSLLLLPPPFRACPCFPPSPRGPGCSPLLSSPGSPCPRGRPFPCPSRCRSPAVLRAAAGSVLGFGARRGGSPAPPFFPPPLLGAAPSFPRPSPPFFLLSPSRVPWLRLRFFSASFPVSPFGRPPPARLLPVLPPPPPGFLAFPPPLSPSSGRFPCRFPARPLVSSPSPAAAPLPSAPALRFGLPRPP